MRMLMKEDLEILRPLHHEFFSRNSFASLTFVARYGLPPRSGWFNNINCRWFFRILSFVNILSLHPLRQLAISSSQVHLNARTLTVISKPPPSYSFWARNHLCRMPFPALRLLQQPPGISSRQQDLRDPVMTIRLNPQICSPESLRKMQQLQCRLLLLSNQPCF